MHINFSSSFYGLPFIPIGNYSGKICCDVRQYLDKVLNEDNNKDPKIYKKFAKYLKNKFSDEVNKILKNENICIDITKLALDNKQYRYFEVYQLIFNLSYIREKCNFTQITNLKRPDKENNKYDFEIVDIDNNIYNISLKALASDKNFKSGTIENTPIYTDLLEKYKKHIENNNKKKIYTFITYSFLNIEDIFNYFKKKEIKDDNFNTFYLFEDNMYKILKSPILYKDIEYCKTEITSLKDNYINYYVENNQIEIKIIEIFKYEDEYIFQLTHKSNETSQIYISKNKSQIKPKTFIQYKTLN